MIVAQTGQQRLEGARRLWQFSIASMMGFGIPLLNRDSQVSQEGW